jgi:hypothetical protein
VLSARPLVISSLIGSTADQLGLTRRILRQGRWFVQLAELVVLTPISGSVEPQRIALATRNSLAAMVLCKAAAAARGLVLAVAVAQVVLAMA